MTFQLAPLPYPEDALEPHISKKTMEFHYGKHHKGYVDKLNAIAEKTNVEGDDVVAAIWASQDLSNADLFNNAAQVWNHDFFWNSMSPETTKPSSELAQAIEEDFNGMDGFKEAFKDCATGQFGSGWAWLVAREGELDVISTANADLPLTYGLEALLCCDVWEHAYYLDYQNKRGEFVDAFLEHLVNWDFASSNWDAAERARSAETKRAASR
ncbi:MAG TPA: superoxide dismutase [Alphaproteobacteria bacterium]|nr:superoxide dismutase [Alphaproteobacteria bacterium]